MITVRSFIFLCGQIISVILVCVLLLPTLVMPSVRDKVISSWALFNLYTLELICGIKYRLHGAENIPTTPTIIISNHQSAWETLFFQKIFPPLSFILKKELLRIPFFGWGLAAYKPIAIDRSQKVKALDQLIKQGKERIEQGRWPVIYPEGTRMAPGSPGKFQVGGVMIAVKTGTPILLVAHNAGLHWPKNGFLKYPGTIDVVIGPVIETAGRKTRDVNQEAESWILEQLEKLPASRQE